MSPERGDCGSSKEGKDDPDSGDDASPSVAIVEPVKRRAGSCCLGNIGVSSVSRKRKSLDSGSSGGRGAGTARSTTLFL